MYSASPPLPIPSSSRSSVDSKSSPLDSLTSIAASLPIPMSESPTSSSSGQSSPVNSVERYRQSLFLHTSNQLEDFKKAQEARSRSSSIVSADGIQSGPAQAAV